MAPLPTLPSLLPPRKRWAPERQPIDDLRVSSLELDVRSPEAITSDTTLQARDGLPRQLLSDKVADIDSRSMDTTTRDVSSKFAPGQGTRPASSFNNSGFLALFAIIGAVMVVVSLWFFFWAKNGGFHFQEGDWDDYKSTVLRRKGPDGKTLSNATKSTKLGGSTIAGTQYYKWAKQEARSVVGRDEKGRKGIVGKRGWAKTHSVTYTDDYMTDSFGTQSNYDAMTEVRSEVEHKHHSKRYRDRDVREYKKERPARVGGLNRVADGSHVDGSITNPSEIHSEASDRPILHKSSREREKERAERRAREEAAKMERRWKREAEEAAAALARESIRNVPPPSSARKNASPSKNPESRRSSRSASPKKRPASEVASSTAYTQTTTTNRSASYYDEYRPRASENPRYSSDHGNRSRQSSPKKKQTRSSGTGYRRNADSDFE